MKKLHPRLYISLILFAVVALSHILQIAIATLFPIADISPDILIIAVASAGFLLGKKEGMAAGFLAGLLYDYTNGQIIGFNALLYMLIGYSNGYLKRIFFMERYKFSLLIIGLSDFVLSFSRYVITFLLRGRTDVWFYLHRIILPEFIYTVLISGLLFPVYKLIYGKLETIKVNIKEKNRTEYGL